MAERSFYIDPAQGNDADDGLAPARAARTHASRDVRPGDRVLFRRGSVIRDLLAARSGVAGAPVIYGAYDEGDAPAFLGSVPAGDPDRWVEERPSLWRYEGGFPSEVCNLVFDGGASCGNLRWRVEDLEHPGEWHYTRIGANKAGETQGEAGHHGGVLYLCSRANPGRAFSSIECALWGHRKLAEARQHVVIENLSFRNSGVHGYQQFHAHDVVIRNCEFRFIGGAVWSLEHRVRFGNAVELWDGASDVTVEGCRFDNIYDAGVTHQGGGTQNVPERIHFLGNLFVDCGLAAYECREPSREVHFEHNTCVNAGGGFSMQGEPPPRRSEIYVRDLDDGEVELVLLSAHSGSGPGAPRPIHVGHHVFIWRIDRGTQDGKVYIRNNVFSQAPYGAAVYSIIGSDDMREFVLDQNHYLQTRGDLLAYVCGRSYRPPELDRFRAEWGQ